MQGGYDTRLVGASRSAQVSNQRQKTSLQRHRPPGNNWKLDSHSIKLNPRHSGQTQYTTRVRYERSRRTAIVQPIKVIPSVTIQACDGTVVPKIGSLTIVRKCESGLNIATA